MKPEDVLPIASPPRKPFWNRERTIAGWVIFGILGIDACIAVAHWEAASRPAVAAAVGAHVVGLAFWRVVRAARSGGKSHE